MSTFDATFFLEFCFTHLELMDFLQASLALQLCSAHKLHFFLCKVAFDWTCGLVNWKRYKTILLRLESVKLVLALHLRHAKILGLHRWIIGIWLFLHAKGGSRVFCLLVLEAILCFLRLICRRGYSKCHMLGR